MKQMRLLVVLLIPVVALILGGAVSTVWAKRGFEDADVYAELNDTDEDLGFHALIDGEAWKLHQSMQRSSHKGIPGTGGIDLVTRKGTYCITMSTVTELKALLPIADHR